MKKAYVILALSIIVGAGAGTYELALQPGRNASPPPEIVMAYQGNSHHGALGDYCWPDPPSSGTCPEPANLYTSSAIPPPTHVARGSSVTFQVNGQSGPSYYEVTIFSNNGGNLTKVVGTDNVTGTLQMSMDTGAYDIFAFGVWSDGRAVGYTFAVEVS
jgi:hypothetical protein